MNGSDDLVIISHHIKQTLDPRLQKSAEDNLRQLEASPNFLLNLIQLIKSDNVDAAVRFGAVIYFKNFIKRNWHIMPTEADCKIGGNERIAIKNEIIPLLCSLPSNLQIQLGDCVSAIAESDFPEQWPEIIPTIRDKLTDSDPKTNISILQIAHSIFKRYRSTGGTSDIVREIMYVLEEFAPSFLNLMKLTDERIQQLQANKVELLDWLNLLHLLTKIFYDLNYIEFPDFFADHFKEFSVIFLKYLPYNNKLVYVDFDESEATIIEKIKGTICEILTLFSKKYDEDFENAQEFVKAVWELLTTTGLGVKYDILVSHAIKFLVSVANQIQHREMFHNEEILKGICEKVILPNMFLRETDEELFNDDPIEFIRRDLEGSNADTRRGAASELVSALLTVHPQLVTEIFSKYVELNLQEYSANPKKNWKSKDMAMFLITSLSVVGQTSRLGATKVNELVPILPFLQSTVLPDLRAPENILHPLLIADALKFVMTFRSLLNKEQLFEILNLDLAKLSSDKYVIYTYAAICIEKILGGHSGNENDASLISEVDIKDVSPLIINRLFELIYRGGTPEKVSENDYLMKTITRVILVTKVSLSQTSIDILDKLNPIIQMVSQNPSNPTFNGYCFSSISNLIKYVAPANPQLLLAMETRLYPTLIGILEQEITEFVPYAYQILALLVLSHTKTDLTQNYKDLVKSTLQPTSWQNREAFASMIEYLRAVSYVDSDSFVINKYLEQMLGVTQRLIGSKVNDYYGFLLVTNIFTNFSIQQLSPYTRNIFMMLLTRLMQAKTDQFVRGFVIFITTVFNMRKEGFGSDDLLNLFNQIQDGMFVNLLQSIIIPFFESPMNLDDRKKILEGWNIFMNTSSIIKSEPYRQVFPRLVESLQKLST